jgi:hypothetical protein
MQTHPAFDAAIAGAAKQLDQRYGAIFGWFSLFKGFARVFRGILKDFRSGFSTQRWMRYRQRATPWRRRIRSSSRGGGWQVCFVDIFHHFWSFQSKNVECALFCVHFQ